MFSLAPAPPGRQPPAIREVRCRCAGCGVHSSGWAGTSLSGQCPNCGSYDVRPVEPAATPKAA